MKSNKHQIPHKLLTLIHSLAILLLTGCSATHHKRSADKETLGILNEKSKGIARFFPDFNIKPKSRPDLGSFNTNPTAADFLGKRGQAEVGARTITLDEALGLAVAHNRNYHGQKETLYLQALNLTLIRHQLTPIFTATGSIARNKQRITGNNANNQTNPISTRATAQAASTVQQSLNNIITDNTYTRTGSIGFSNLQRIGTRLTADFTSDFLRFVSGTTPSANNSSLAATLTQPLLRGAGYKATMETITQADRDVLYALRDFTRFRKTFVIDIASRYYLTLQARDAARNAWISQQSFITDLNRGEGLAEKDRITITDLGQLRQAALRAELQWVNAVTNYEEQLDELKIELGIPVPTIIVLDDKELDNLKILPPKLTLEKAIEVALASRLDLQNSHDRHEDAIRRIDVAKNSLLPSVDAVGTLNVPSTTGTGFQSPKWDRRTWSAGLDINLPIDSKEVRNLYRTALIDEQRTAREYELASDQIILQIKQHWRRLEQAAKQFQIAELAVTLSRERVNQQRLLAEVGQGRARDLVEAQQDLVDALDQRTRSLINHNTERLTFWRDLGILYIKQNGHWQKSLQAEPETKK